MPLHTGMYSLANPYSFAQEDEFTERVVAFEQQLHALKFVLQKSQVLGTWDILSS